MSRQLQLYMWRGQRKVILSQHDFYVEQVKARVLRQFDDIEAEAERFGDQTYEDLGNQPGDENSDMADVAEAATEMAQERYMLLADLKKQMLLGSLAGLYHQWDKTLREFIEQELRHDLHPETAARTAWKGNIGDIFDALAEFGWDSRSLPLFSKLDACRLIVNVYKHGKGPSLAELAAQYPAYLDDEYLRTSELPVAPLVDHDWLSISEGQFDEIAAALREFWVVFPERLFLEMSAS